MRVGGLPVPEQLGRKRRWLTVVFIVLFLLLVTTQVGVAHPGDVPSDNPLPALAVDGAPASRGNTHEPEPLQAVHNAPCIDGSAAGFPCHNMDLLAFLPMSEIGGTRHDSTANDVWGWTDPQTGKEIAIVGRRSGTSFVDVSNPINPIYLGELPAHGGADSFWRDVKVYADHAFIVSEAHNHGMQVFDLTQLRTAIRSPVTLRETAFYAGVSSAHNIAINEDTGFAYITGASGKNSCSGGLHMVDISNPASPTFAGCFDADGYTHDAQCVLYDGPDADHQGREICLNSNEDTLTIVDVTDKSRSLQVSRVGYAGSGYVHQGWLTADQRFFLLDDELDEQTYGHNTRTRIWDLSDLDRPALLGFFESSTPAMDHNLYVQGHFAYQANYRAGLRVLDISQIAAGDLLEVAFFDVYPANDAPQISGAWSTYPYFASGIVIVSGIEQGLFVLRPDLQKPSEVPPLSQSLAHGAGSGAADVTITSLSPPYLSITPQPWAHGPLFLLWW